MTSKKQAKLPLIRVVLLCVLTLISLNFLLTLYSSHWLRPAADDYCLAWIAGKSGVIGSTIGSWNTVNGYLVSVFSASIWVGWPLAHLPLSLASLIPFVAAALGLGLFVACLCSKFLGLGKVKVIFFCMLIAFCWWIFLWAPEAYDGLIFTTNSFQMRETFLLAYGLTHWQTSNGLYILQLVTVLLGLWIVVNFCPKQKWKRYFLYTFLGLISGMTGPTLAASIILFSVAVLISWRINNFKNSYVLESELFCFIFASLIGLLVTQFLSPGNYQRQAMVGTSFELSPMQFIDLIDISFRFAIRLWFSGYISLGALLVFILCLGISFFYSNEEAAEKIKPIRDLGFLFGLFSLLQIFINRAAEFFAYQGYWHFISPIACIFISICCIGVWAGVFIYQSEGRIKFATAITFALLLASLMGTSANLYMVKSIYQRQALWSGGPAPTPGVTDIDVEWVRGCWKELNKLRPTQIER